MPDPILSMPILVQNRLLDELANLLVEGNQYPNPTIRIYSIGGMEEGCLLSVLHMQSPPFTKARDGIIYSHPIETTTALASGTPSVFGLFSKGNKLILQGSVGGEASNCTLRIKSNTCENELSAPPTRKGDITEICNFVISLK